MGKLRAVKPKMPLIPQCPGLAQGAALEMRGVGWSCKPTLFNWQSMQPPRGIASAAAGLEMGMDLKIWHSLQLTGTQKPSKVYAELGPLEGSCSWGDMQTTPNLLELTLHVRLKPEGAQACNARK